MRRIYRRLLQFSSLVVFLATAPLMVFYAMGYRLSPKSIDPLPVGALMIESIPRHAHISINGRGAGITPKSIANLTPGKVSITVSKQGYGEWHKEFSIEPTAVTEARSIRLFPIQPHMQVMLRQSKIFSLAPNRHLLAVLAADGRLHILDDEGEAITDPLRIDHPADEIFWSSDSGNLLLLGPRSTQLVQLTKLRAGGRVLPSLQKAQDIVWDPRIPGRLLVLNQENVLVAHNIDTQQRVPLIADVKAFATSSRHIYAVNNSGILTIHDLQGRVIRTLPIALEKPAAKLHVTPAGRVAIEFADHGVAVVNDRDELRIITDKKVETVSWSPDGQLLLLQVEPTALYVYNAADERPPYVPLDELQLIVRLSRPIHTPQWFAGSRHLIYQSDDEIIITEIDTRDHPVMYTVDATNLGEALVTVGRNGEVLYYLKRTDSSTDLIATSLLAE